MNTMKWYFREFRSELILVALAVISFCVAPAVQAQPLTRACSGDVPEVAIPPDALHKVEVIQPQYQPPQKMADLGYDHITPTVNVVTTYPCSRGIGSMVEISEIRLVRYDHVTKTRTTERVFKYGTANTLVGEMWYREPIWFQSGQPNPQPYVTWINNGNFAVSVQSTPLGVYHWWGHPRLKVKPGYAYFVEARIRVIGDTLVQLGLDGWRGSETKYNGFSNGCVNSNNCEAFQSHWIGPTNGQFVTVITPMTLYLP